MYAMEWPSTLTTPSKMTAGHISGTAGPIDFQFDTGIVIGHAMWMVVCSHVTVSKRGCYSFRARCSFGFRLHYPFPLCLQNLKFHSRMLVHVAVISSASMVALNKILPVMFCAGRYEL